MELDNNDAAVRTDSADAQVGTVSAGEIDLYDELVAFAELSPEEQLRLLDRPETVAAETEFTSADQTQENAFSEPVLTHAPIELVEAETAAAETEAPSAEEAEEHTSPEQVLTHLPMESVESETAPAETATPFTEEAEEYTSPEHVLTHPPVEPVESESAATETITPSTEEAETHTLAVPAAESGSDSEVLRGDVEPDEGRPEAFEGSRPSGPLSGFNLTPDFVFTGALSRGVCLACGAESGADDLFCMTCGVFIDEIASTLPFNSTCAECKQGIAVDEIFCPWCGSSLPE